MDGIFITFEGGEGSGKSTQIRLLSQALIQMGKNVLTTREPGGSPGAEEIRQLLVQGATDRWDDVTETLLFFAARRDHLIKKILPAIQAGQVVLSDRFADSTMAYQGYGYGDNPYQQNLIKSLYKQVIGDFEPELTVLLDIPVEEGLKRSRRTDNTELRFENKEITFHERLRAAYLTLAKQNPERFFIVDATQTPDTIHQQIMQEIVRRNILDLEKNHV